MPEERDKPGDELTDAVDRIGRGVWGLGTRLFGARVVPPPTGESTPISPEAEAAIDAAGATVGRWLHAAGKAMAAHPMDPKGAVDEARERLVDVPEPGEGETVLTAGIRDLGGGLYKVAEGVLDVVAPRGKAASTGDAGATAEPATGEEGPA